MDILWTIAFWVLFGLVVGVLARWLVPGHNPMSLGGTILLGILGSLLGGFIWWLIFDGHGPFQPGGFLLALGGAVLALLLRRKLFPRNTLWR